MSVDFRARGYVLGVEDHPPLSPKFTRNLWLPLCSGVPAIILPHSAQNVGWKFVLRNYANSEAIAAGGTKLPGSKLLAWCLRRLKGVVTFLENLKIFRRYSDREWIVIILLSISISKTFQIVGDGYHLRFGQGPLSGGVRVECEDLAVLLDFNRKIDICITFKTIFKSLFE